MASASFRSYPSLHLFNFNFPLSLLDFACRRSVIHVILPFFFFPFFLVLFFRANSRPQVRIYVLQPPSSSPFVITIKFFPLFKFGSRSPYLRAALILKEGKKKSLQFHL